MHIVVTGDLRDIANSAWISTHDEVKAKQNTHEKVLKTVKYLIANDHTSPLESVSITLGPGPIPEPYLLDKYSRYSDEYLTIDLLNFLKVTFKHDLKNEEPWKLFELSRPELAKVCSEFKPLSSEVVTTDTDDLLGDHDMSVELIGLHNINQNKKLSRATWRVKCPLSIAVQIKRHRSGSFNVVSGRYRTIHQDLVKVPNDCRNIFEKCGLDSLAYMQPASDIIELYEETMKKFKESKDSGAISNDEYKRVREFARFILPEGRMTEMYITFYLDDFYNNYLILRDSIHAQVEHRWIAAQMRKILEHS